MCSRQFQVSRTYANAVSWSSLGFTLLFFYLLGLRGVQLLIATVVMWLPMLLICIFIFDKLIPPRLELYYGDGSGLGLSEKD